MKAGFISMEKKLYFQLKKIYNFYRFIYFAAQKNNTILTLN